MNNEYILEGNAKIAEFMELSPMITPQEYEYNDSWDWLMPVVEKISVVSELKNIREACQKYWNSAESDIRIFRESIETTYDECVQFIDWYNLNVKP